MQTVQRAEFWCAIVAMQAYWPCHLGIENLNVARGKGRLLDQEYTSYYRKLATETIQIQQEELQEH